MVITAIINNFQGAHEISLKIRIKMHNFHKLMGLNCNNTKILVKGSLEKLQNFLKISHTSHVFSVQLPCCRRHSGRFQPIPPSLPSPTCLSHCTPFVAAATLACRRLVFHQFLLPQPPKLSKSLSHPLSVHDYGFTLRENTAFYT